MSEDNKKSGFVAIIGRPNVGKSTLMNHLIGQKIAITSEKPQTTRNRIRTVYTDERGQVVFLDTPGMHKAHNKLGEYMMNVAEGTLKDVDLVLWLVEPTTFVGEGEQNIIENLKRANTPVILVINKIDTVKTEQIAEFIKTYSELYDFAEIIPVSALRSKNTKHLLDVIYEHMPVGPMYFDEDTVTDVPEKQILAELIREKALRIMRDEIPHGIAVTIDKSKMRPDGSCLDVDATIVCERDSHKGIIIGKGGAMLKKIGMTARMEAEKLFGYKINLKLWVKVKKDWRDSDMLIKNYGYKEEDE